MYLILVYKYCIVLIMTDGFDLPPEPNRDYSNRAVVLLTEYALLLLDQGDIFDFGFHLPGNDALSDIQAVYTYNEGRLDVPSILRASRVDTLMIHAEPKLSTPDDTILTASVYSSHQRRTPHGFVQQGHRPSLGSEHNLFVSKRAQTENSVYKLAELIMDGLADLNHLLGPEDS